MDELAAELATGLEFGQPRVVTATFTFRVSRELAPLEVHVVPLDMLYQMLWSCEVSHPRDAAWRVARTLTRVKHGKQEFGARCMRDRNTRALRLRDSAAVRRAARVEHPPFPRTLLLEFAAPHLAGERYFSAKVWPNGAVQVSGARCVDEWQVVWAPLHACLLAYVDGEAEWTASEPRISMVNMTAKVTGTPQQRLRLERMVEVLSEDPRRASNAAFVAALLEPEVFPGAMLRVRTPHGECTVLVSVRGFVTVAGATSEEMARAALHLFRAWFYDRGAYVLAGVPPPEPPAPPVQLPVGPDTSLPPSQLLRWN